MDDHEARDMMEFFNARDMRESFKRTTKRKKKKNDMQNTLNHNEKDYYQEWLKCVYLLGKAHYILTTMEILTYGKENESFSKLMSDIEDII